MNVPCTYCGSILDSRLMWQRVVGWQKKAHGGTRRGGSDIALREPREEFACGGCISQLRAGRSPSQDSLL